MMTQEVHFDGDRSRLPHRFDVKALQAETLELIAAYPPYLHYQVIPLTMMDASQASHGDYTRADWASWKPTAALKRSPVIQQVLDSLQCEKTNVRLMRLEPLGEVRPHKDPQLDLDLGQQVRLHVPIFATEEVDFILNGKRLPLQPGELWYMRLSDCHQVINRGLTERIQLSIDVVVNDWAKEQIAAGDVDV